MLLYKQFKEVALHLKKLDNRQQQSFTRLLVFNERINFFPDPEVTGDILRNNILRVISSLKELDNLPKAKVKEAISISEK